MTTKTQDVTVTVNGAARTLACAGTTTLLTVLRDDLLLTGAKRGCNQGVCGACTVLIDGRPMRSCLTLAANLDGAEVTTVEGLAPRGELTRVQESLLKQNAVQCGFCTSGMVMVAHDLLQRSPDPDVEEVRDALSGNLCRCSGYRALVDAVIDAATGGAA